MSEKIFSGKGSQKFWDAVNLSKQDILYEYGCKAQKLESIKDDLLEACKTFCQEFSDYGRITHPRTTDWRPSQEYKEQIINNFEAAIAKAKQE